MRGHSDRGVVVIWISLLLAVLLGMGALVIDVGAWYQERRELQNGADAAAFAVAQDCAVQDCQDEHATAGHFADANARDDRSAVDDVCGSAPDDVGSGLATCTDPPEVPEHTIGWVMVKTSTWSADADDDEVKFVLAPLLPGDFVGGTVDADAVAAWGALGRVTTIPLTFSLCEFEAAGGSIAAGAFPDHPIEIHFHERPEAGSCPAGPSGSDLPGGFGWLESDGCEATVNEDDVVENQTGVPTPSSLGCDPEQWLEEIVIIPIFDDTNELTGTRLEYHIAGFVGFRTLGYQFSGASGGVGCGDSGSDRCLYGEFTKVAVDGGEFGENPFGAVVVRMIG